MSKSIDIDNESSRHKAALVILEELNLCRNASTELANRLSNRIKAAEVGLMLTNSKFDDMLFAFKVSEEDSKRLYEFLNDILLSRILKIEEDLKLL